jgi:hypothetical protein
VAPTLPAPTTVTFFLIFILLFLWEDNDVSYEVIWRSILTAGLG